VCATIGRPAGRPRAFGARPGSGRRRPDVASRSAGRHVAIPSQLGRPFWSDSGEPTIETTPFRRLRAASRSVQRSGVSSVIIATVANCRQHYTVTDPSVRTETETETENESDSLAANEPTNSRTTRRDLIVVQLASTSSSTAAPVARRCSVSSRRSTDPKLGPPRSIETIKWTFATRTRVDGWMDG